MGMRFESRSTVAGLFRRTFRPLLGGGDASGIIICRVSLTKDHIYSVRRAIEYVHKGVRNFFGDGVLLILCAALQPFNFCSWHMVFLPFTRQLPFILWSWAPSHNARSRRTCYRPERRSSGHAPHPGRCCFQNSPRWRKRLQSHPQTWCGRPHPPL